ncbi:GFA family protein [Solimicrobium silvestre]|uniref:CENP-V/GFA domain-containing protein n=1 Tax=Solimicrobium silvestre TaxID=2099400 RepID=A0A2S9GW91_9BURK|nr:GFA family protein [Solimicrobium silvestre]PRC91982.1 hypothetical protein S2091_3324 [Solimicrobium silvestre]
MSNLSTGSCLCGAVHFEYSGEPVFSGNCHCRDCQRSSGSAFTPALFVPEENVSISGAVKYYESKADSGNAISRGFCPNCGSQLFARLEIMPKMLGLRAGTLDDPSNFHPKVNFFTSSASHWDHMNPDLPTYPKSPR